MKVQQQEPAHSPSTTHKSGISWSLRALLWSVGVQLGALSPTPFLLSRLSMSLLRSFKVKKESGKTQSSSFGQEKFTSAFSEFIARAAIHVVIAVLLLYLHCSSLDVPQPPFLLLPVTTENGSWDLAQHCLILQHTQGF